MASYGPGPTVVEAIYTGVSFDLGDRLQRRDYLVNLHSASKERVRVATAIAAGEWYTIWPNLAQTKEGPTVANVVEMGINHWASILGGMLPSITVPTNATQDRAQAKRGARKRERRLRELWKKSYWSELAAKNGADYAGAGFSILGVWANFGEANLAKRNPYVVHYDPRHTYVLKNDLGEITELLVARRLTQQALAGMLAKEYPDIYKRLKDRVADVEEWVWFDQEKFFRCIIDVSKEGRETGRWIVLVNEENKLGFVPAWEVVRPTFDGERRGIFDQAIHILRTMHRLMLLTIQSTEEHSWPAIGVFDVANPEDIGIGAILRYRSGDAKVDRLGPAQHLDVKDLISRLGDEAARVATYPQQLSGEPGGSIVSARGVTASMGALDARLVLAHTQFEVMYSKICTFLLAMDEVYCNGEKMIVGDSTDNSKAESFFPERDINGAWTASATYGIGAGSDPGNIEIRLAMHTETGFISQETARQHLSYIADPDGERVKIFRGQMETAIVQSAIQIAATGDPTLAAEAWKLVSKDDADMDDVIMQLVEFIQTPPEPQGGPTGSASPAAGVLQMGESLARGGTPGAAGGVPGAALPPLGQIMNQDARYVS